MATSPCPQITLDLEDSSISTKGTKSGAFVMYNCARLATLFDTYQQAVERGEHQPCDPPLTATPGLLLTPGATGASLGTTVSRLLSRHVPTSATSIRTELLLPPGGGEC